MNVIDHAILIPASPAFIWRFIGDISQTPRWQEDCNNVSFLTTQREGRGTRWRYSTQKGSDIVVEITAWYDTLGFEYVIVDGSQVGENKGRIRLQEIAEGTLVQWTFNYNVEGVLSGLRNTMGIKRSLTNNIQDSLRNLYKLIQNETGGIQTHEAKALLKEAPDVEERSSYKPRHPSAFQEHMDGEVLSEPDYPSEHRIAYNLEYEPIIEPPIADDDTKPNPVVQGTEEIPSLTGVNEPSFLQQIPEPPVTDVDTKPHAPILDEESNLAVVPTSIDHEDTIHEADIEDNPAEASNTSEPDLQQSPSSDIRDTSTISVFELFGLQKPSETEEMRAITDAEVTKASEIEEVRLPTPPHADLDTENQPNFPEVIDDAPESDEQEIPTPINNDDTLSRAEVKFSIKETVEHSEVQPTDISTKNDLSAERLTGFRLAFRRGKMVQLRSRK